MYQSSILAQDSGSGGSSLGLLFFLIIPVAMYFLMIHPEPASDVTWNQPLG